MSFVCALILSERLEFFALIFLSASAMSLGISKYTMYPSFKGKFFLSILAILCSATFRHQDHLSKYKYAGLHFAFLGLLSLTVLSFKIEFAISYGNTGYSVIIYP